jgi:dienelactone hydrolase
MGNKNFNYVCLILFCCLALAGCRTEDPATPEQPAVQSQPRQENAQESQLVEMEPSNQLPTEPQLIIFTTSDGQELEGMFYPPESESSPLVVLMHWAQGDMSNWKAIAAWLQNRGAETESAAGLPSYLDPAWFPPIPADRSFAVFTFTFRNCEGGCRSFEREKWLLDAQAAMTAAIQQPGVDTSRVVAVGASIGADGAADGCLWLNQQQGDFCQGAFSLSPGDYLTESYSETAAQLGKDKPIWCLYASQDAESAKVCQAAAAANYRAVEYPPPSTQHGMDLIQPDTLPNPLDLLIEFLNTTVGQ